MAQKKNNGWLGNAAKFALKCIYTILVYVLGIVVFNPLTIAVLNLVANEWLEDTKPRRSDGWVKRPMYQIIWSMKVVCNLIWFPIALIGGSLIIVLGVLVFNPIVVWVIALFAPKWLLSSSDCASNDFHEIFVYLPLAWQKKWIWRVFPWHARKYFVEEWFVGASSKDRVRLTLERPDLFFSLSDSEKETVFCYAATWEQRLEWVSKNAELSAAMFTKLCQDGVQSVKKYVEVKRGLDRDELIILCSMAPTDVVCDIVLSLQISDDELVILANYSKHFPVLLALLQKQGCGKNAVMPLMHIIGKAPGCCQDALEKMIEALSQWRQKGEVSKTADNIELFTEFCKAEADIYPDALKKMTVEQYRVYKGLGKKLPDGVLRYFVSNGSEEMVKAVFELEDELLDAKYIISSSPELHLLLLQIRKEQEGKKGKVEAEKLSTAVK